MPRPIERVYQDPLETVWLECARRVGLEVRRSADTYASADGAGQLILSDSAGLDADDSLCQMILHELCHTLVQGAQSFAWIDWGLDNEGQRDDELERACLRLQAALLEPLGLRRVLAPTTDFRGFYDELPTDPFEEREPGERESIVRGRAAFARRHAAPWGPHLEEALRATRAIVEQAAGYAGPGSLLGAAGPAAPLHRLGLPQHPEPGRRCGDCAWAKRSPSGRLGCTVQAGRRVRDDEAACERHEGTLDCQSCGACCREAYDLVVVKRSDPAARLHLELLVPSADGYDLRRDDGRCRALEGGTELPRIVPAIAKPGDEESRQLPQKPRYMPGEQPFSCRIYETRPQTCRDFTRGSANCLAARRLVGLSR